MNGDKKASYLHNLVAVLAVSGGLLGMAGLYFFEIPAVNLQPLLLALGVILGWGGTIVAAEFGSVTEKTTKESVTAGDKIGELLLTDKDRVKPKDGP